MTVAEARKILREPLTFGHQGQIAAVRVVSLMEELTTLIHRHPREARKAHCMTCLGDGYRGYVKTELCPKCGGNGRALPRNLDVSGLEPMDEVDVAMIVTNIKKLSQVAA